jgi:acetyl esterase/lipase
LLFPDKSPDSLLEKMPPTVVFSAEFDMFITETERMVRRMRRAGTLLDYCCMPG